MHSGNRHTGRVLAAADVNIADLATGAPIDRYTANLLIRCYKAALTGQP